LCRVLHTSSPSLSGCGRLSKRPSCTFPFHVQRDDAIRETLVARTEVLLTRLRPYTERGWGVCYGLCSLRVEYFDDEDISLDRPTQEVSFAPEATAFHPFEYDQTMRKMST
jgi:hypothetical protein